MTTQQSYFSNAMSAKSAFENDTSAILKTMLGQFIGDNPVTDLSPAIQYPDWQTMDHRGQLSVGLNEILASASIGVTAELSSNLKSFTERTIGLDLRCFGPTQCYLNDELIFSSGASQENMRRKNNIPITLHPGFNELRILTEKTSMGFGVVIGSANPKWDPLHFFLSATELGFKLDNLDEYVNDEAKAFELHAGMYLLKVALPVGISTTQYMGDQSITVFDGATSKLVQSDEMIKAKTADNYLHIAFELSDTKNGLSSIRFSNISDQSDWLLCGPIDETDLTNKSFAWEKLHEDASGQTIYWQRYSDDRFIRLVSNAAAFGYWNYPMGVSLYGMNTAGKYFDNATFLDYVHANMSIVKRYDAYARWDQKQFNFNGISSHLYWMEALDDCGSFGSALLEVNGDHLDDTTRAIADNIADYMTNHQQRETDGAFSREDWTMWIDDLYMSVPFLVRYWQLTGDERYLKDAIMQFKTFKKRMFIPEENLMSHIFDTVYKKPNLIPWSRGNGWVLFSLSELLDRMTTSQISNEEISEFYNQMAVGVMSSQDETGLWHQVLDEPSTYLESSSTAMFICALSRGIRSGYLADELSERAIRSINLAWDGLISICIDQFGDLYGTCHGSGFSFSKDYYMNHLGWNKNDTHGIGIVALAGTEYQLLQDYLGDGLKK